MVGSTLGHYEILEPLGQGGMGEVYRARDATLKRHVAIKLLPEELAGDRDRLARLEREAHLLAALNHPNIATIHSLEAVDGIRFLVLELVKGESLEQRLAAGPIPVDQALELCKQIAEALEAAHGEGIIHRDLKPANVLITPQGRAKVLDFGLAKAFESNASARDVTQSPTLTVAGTQAGVILGTAPYMSPEQVRGQPLDKRADNWAFGCVLYETLTASRAFARETVAETLAAVLETEPNWRALPGATPAAIVALIRRCLRKDPSRRVHDIADARIEIEDALGGVGSEMDPAGGDLHETSPPSSAPSIAPHFGRQALPWFVATIAILVAIASVWNRSPAIDPGPGLGVIPFPLPLPEGVEIANPPRAVISPAGNRIAVVGIEADNSSLWVWDLNSLSLTPTPVAGSEGAIDVFDFSPDGGELLYEADERVHHIDIRGGSGIPVTMAEDGFDFGAAWATPDAFIFQLDSTPLFRVPLDGGDHVELTELPTGILSHRWPQALTDGTVIFTEQIARPLQADSEQWQVSHVPPGEKQPQLLVENASYGRYVEETGHLVFARDNSLIALPFDLEDSRPTGLPRAVITDLWTTMRVRGGSAFDFAGNGTFVYVPAEPERRFQPVVVSESGDPTDVENLAPRNYETVRFAPGDDSTYLMSPPFGASEYWIIVHRAGSRTRELPFDDLRSPIWHSNGRELIAVKDVSSDLSQLVRIDLDSDAEPTMLFETETGIAFPEAVTRDGTALIYREWDERAYRLHEYLLETGDPDDPGNHRDLFPNIVQSSDGTLSPNGEFLAYASLGEVLVRTYSPGGNLGPARQVSEGGGSLPRWSRDGRLFYVAAGMMMVSEMGAGSDPDPGQGRPLFEVPSDRGYDVLPDGGGFLMFREIEEPGRRRGEVKVILNFFDLLNESAPPGRQP